MGFLRRQSVIGGQPGNHFRDSMAETTFDSVRHAAQSHNGIGVLHARPADVVLLHQVHGELHISGGLGPLPQQFAVTVARQSGSWTVYAFELADQGQAGDTGAAQ